ncbi:hypothetical protein [Stieleria marina]
MRRLIRAPAMLSFVWPAMLIIGGYVAWHQWGAEYMNSKYYGVAATQFQVSEPPKYVRSDIVQTVYQDTAMENLSLLDTQATSKIASAFATHPWVRQVNSVRKLPGGQIDVRLDYRKPVAMVRVISKHPDVRGSSFFAVDGEGVLLPPSEFSREETSQYVHIAVPDTYPRGSVGRKFGDFRVEAAAKVAAIIAPYNQHAAANRQVTIKTIGVHGDPRQTTVPQLELETASGKKKFWGSSPGMELPGEPTAEMKLRVLVSSGDENIDLRIARLPANETH